MKLRVLLPLFLFGVLTVIAILVPAGQAMAQSRTQQLQLQRTGAVGHMLQRAYAAIEGDDTKALERYLERFSDTYDEAVLVVDGAGRPIASSGGISSSHQVTTAVRGALRGVPQRSLETIYPWSDGENVVAAPLTLDGGAPEGAVVLAVNSEAARADVAAGWALVVTIGVALLSALLVASILWTRWIVRPVLALDTATRALAEQREFSPTHATGPPELRRLARSFERMTRSVEHALEQQRGLVADASHQLRNPLAAVRLRIDALAHVSDPGTADRTTGSAVEVDQEDLAAIAHDLDRLERTVERMLVLANAEHRAAVAASRPRDMDRPDWSAECVTSADDLIAPHRAVLREAGIGVTTTGETFHLACRLGDLEEIVEIIVDNARKYATGADLCIGIEARHAGGATLEISDSGPGLSAEELSRVGTRFWRSDVHRELPGTGLGYAIVEQLARANRGTVSVDASPRGGLRTRINLETA